MITILAHEAAKEIFKAVAIAVLSAAGVKLATYGLDKAIEKIDKKKEEPKPSDEKEEPEK